MNRTVLNVWAKKARGFGILGFVMGLWGLIGSFLLLPLASAGPGDFFTPIVVLSGTLIGGGLLLVVIGVVLGRFGGEPGEAVRDPFVGIGAVLLVIGIIGMVIPYIPVGPSPPPPPPGGAALKLFCQTATIAAGGPGGAHDAVTEFPTGNSLTAADGGTPDNNRVILTPTYQGLKVVRDDITVDDEQNAFDSPFPATGTQWLSISAYAFDINCRVDNPPNAVGGGFKAIGLFGQLSVPYLFGQMGNMTQTTAHYCSVTGGIHLGFGKVADGGTTATGHDANHDFISAWNSRTCSVGGLSLTSDVVSLGGTSTTSPQNGEWVSVFDVLDVGIISYEETTVTYTMKADFWAEDAALGRSNTESFTFTYIVTDD